MLSSSPEARTQEVAGSVGRQAWRTLTVYGLPCGRTRQAVLNAAEAASLSGEEIRVEWVSDPEVMSERHIVRTPTIAAGDAILLVGRIPTIHELTELIAGESIAG